MDPSISLLDRGLFKASLLANGWVEKRGGGRELVDRITDKGLAEMKKPVRLYDGVDAKG